MSEPMRSIAARPCRRRKLIERPRAGSERALTLAAAVAPLAGMSLDVGRILHVTRPTGRQRHGDEEPTAGRMGITALQRIVNRSYILS